MLTRECIEWDSSKATSNNEKHGIEFEQACSVFVDPFAIELVDDRKDYGEPRYILIGRSKQGVLTVIHTPREDKHRIISARKASEEERAFYYEQNRE